MFSWGLNPIFRVNLIYALYIVKVMSFNIKNIQYKFRFNYGKAGKKLA